MTQTWSWLRDARLWAAGALGIWAAAAATLPHTSGLLLAGIPAAAAVAWWALCGATRWLALFFACSLLAPPFPLPGGGSAHIAPVVAALGVLAGVLRPREWQRPRGTLPWTLAAFAAVLAASSAPAALYSGPQVAAGTLARVLLFGLGVYVFFYTYTGPGARGSALPMARFLFWAGAASAAFACLDFRYQFPTPAGYSQQFMWLGDGVFRRAQGVFYEASTLGNLSVFFLVMTAVAFTEPAGRRPCGRFTLAAGGALFGAALILSYSRGSLVNLAVALAAMGWMRGIRVWKTAVVLLVCAAVGGWLLHFAFPSAADGYWARLGASVEYLGSSTNSVLSGRLTSWNTLLDFLMREPWNAVFGIGYKTLPYSNYAGEHIIADNTYLSLLIETGVTGLTVFLLMNAAILRTAWRAARSSGFEASFFGRWIFCFWCGQTVQMLSGDLITYWRVMPVYLWVLAAAARQAIE
jgi:O-antigen ligase